MEDSYTSVIYVSMHEFWIFSCSPPILSISLIINYEKIRTMAYFHITYRDFKI